MPYPTRRDFLAAGAVAIAAHKLASADTSSDLAALSLKEASEGIRAKKFSPTEITDACLDSVKTWNPKINAWITVLREQALAHAKELGKTSIRGALHGLPIGIKDSIDTAGTRTTAASAVYEYRVPSEDAEVVRRLRVAGAIVLGKCNMHEFDAGASSAVSYWGPVRNPWHLERVAGGPSGGSAAAVIMGNCFGALGTDSNGGIRIPASYCGATGLKPTYGRVSLRGIVPFAWSLDHCGPIARSAEDAAILLREIAGYDHLDIDSLDRPVSDYIAAMGGSVSSLRIGVAPQFFDHLDDEIARAVDDALGVLRKMTKGSREVALPSLLHAGVGAEIAAYHEGLRGVNGGGYEPSTANAFPAGQDATRATDYIKGWRELTMVRRTVNDEVFRKQEVDVLIAPVTRHLPHTIEGELNPSGANGGGRGGGGQTHNLDAMDNTRPFNGYGLPAISIPCGVSRDGLPIGLQIAGPLWEEGRVLALAHAYQRETDWHRKRPSLQPDAKVPALSKTASEQTGG